MRETEIVKELSPLFDPRSIAVIGATNDVNKWGFLTFISTVSEFKGKVYPVNWKEEKVLGYPAFKKVTDIPDPVDLAVFVIPGPNVPAVMEDCVEKGVRSAVIISAGFAEMGEEGRKVEEDLIKVAKKGKIPFVGPNCMGMWSASSNLLASMLPMIIRDGPFAIVTQGGWLGVTIAEAAYARGMDFHRYVSCGRAVGIQIEDYIEYFSKDPEVKIILAYIEGLNDGRRFIDKVKEVTPKKPVVVLKPGKGKVTARAIMSHSGALCGSYQMYDEAFKKSGVIRVDTVEELLDVGAGLISQPLPKGRNVAIITGGGSFGVVAADCCIPLELNVLNLPEDILAYFNTIFPPRWSHGNPIDPAGDRNLVASMKAVERVLALREVDSVILAGMGGMSCASGLVGDLNLPIVRDIIRLLPAILSSAVSAIDINKIMGGFDIGRLSKQFLSLISSPLFASILGFPSSGPSNAEGTEMSTVIEEMIEKVVPLISPMLEGKIVDTKKPAAELVDLILSSEKIDIIGLTSSLLEMIGPTIGYFMAAGDEKDAKEFASLFTPLIESILKSNKEDIVSLVENAIPDIVSIIASFFTSGQLINIERLLGAADSIMGMVVLNWISTYEKPVITTTALEGTTRLINLNNGSHFAYPSPERAAKVLAKLVEYKEYLDRECGPG